MEKFDQVRVVRLDGREMKRVRLGQVGEVLATRYSDGRRQVLVKLCGKAGPVSFDEDQLEKVQA